MFYDFVRLQRFPLAILTFSPLFSLKTGDYACQEEAQVSGYLPPVYITPANPI
jgi:hypothetical protein